MYKLDFNYPCHIHFMGIGGISMSGFAELLHTEGFTISGSDRISSKTTERLEQFGINIVYGQKASNITPNIDLVVYTAAINPDNPEFKAAVDAAIPIIDRAEMVGQVMKNYENSIAVSGTHGKTTTTSMLSHVYLESQLDPTISVGGMLKVIDGNIRIGHSENLIIEACEYTNSFLKFFPRYSIILNVEEDHLDFFKDIHDIRNSFHLFSQRIPHNGKLVINGEIDNVDIITKDLSCPVITYGLQEDQSYDYNAVNIDFDESGFAQYDVLHQNQIIAHIALHVIGLHNVSNSLAVFALANELHLPMDSILRGLSSFKGTERRFEYKGEIGGVTIIDDYAHHPTEVKATLQSAEKYPHKELYCVFQPHTYTRTKAFLKDFAAALSSADKIILADIYAAREKDPGDISSKDIQKELGKLGKESYYFSTFGEIEDFILSNCTSGDLLITMGAGDVVTIGETLLGK